MDRTLIKIDNGKIVGVINTNDNTLFIGKSPNVIDITNFKDKERLISNPMYFTVTNDKLQEMTKKQKDDVDQKEKDMLPKSVEVIDNKKELEEMRAKLNSIEAKVNILTAKQV